MKTIRLLEDNEDRVAAFQKTIGSLGDAFELKVWRDAPTMIAECESWFPTTALISLDHDLNPAHGSTTDPGTGVQVAQFLGDFLQLQGMTSGLVPYFWPGVLPRNLLFLLVILAHGFRRLWPK